MRGSLRFFPPFLKTKAVYFVVLSMRLTGSWVQADIAIHFAYENVFINVRPGCSIGLKLALSASA